MDDSVVVRRLKSVNTSDLTESKAQQLMLEVGSLLGEMSKVYEEFNDMISPLIQKRGKKVDEIWGQIDMRSKALITFFDSNQHLIPEGMVTLRLRGAGQIQRRKNPDRVLVVGGAVSKAIEELKRLNLGQFVRTVEELDRNALRKTENKGLVESLRNLEIKNGQHSYLVKPAGRKSIRYSSKKERVRRR